MDRKYFLLIGIVLLILAIAGGGYLWWSVKLKAPSASPTPTPEITPTPAPEQTPMEEEAKSDLEQIKEIFTQKYNKPIEEAIINISENTGTYASGGVRFEGEISGAMWLAYNDGEKWLIVFDGQGTIPCSAVDPYDFPTDMVPECWDETTEGLYQR